MRCFLIIFSILFIYGIHITKVTNTGSMYPTLKDNQYILINKFSYGIPVFNPINILRSDKGYIYVSTNRIQRGDIVSFINNKDTYVKRIVAKEGDLIKFVNGRLYLKTKEKFEKDPYLEYIIFQEEKTSVQDINVTIKVPNGKVFVLGDNRDISTDSRNFGFIDIENIRGKVFSY